MIRYFIICLVSILLVPLVSGVKLALSPDALFFTKEKTEHQFTVINPNKYPIETTLAVKKYPELFLLSENNMKLYPNEHRKLTITFYDHEKLGYIEDHLQMIVSSKDAPIKLQPGVSIKLSARGSIAKNKEIEKIEKTPLRKNIIVKEPKGTDWLSTSFSTLSILLVLGGVVWFFQRS